MSASEKLKELERGMDEGMVIIMDSEQARTVIDALPEIVAVVKAVEQREAVHVLNRGSETAMAPLLRALDEALSSK